MKLKRNTKVRILPMEGKIDHSTYVYLKGRHGEIDGYMVRIKVPGWRHMSYVWVPIDFVEEIE